MLFFIFSLDGISKLRAMPQDDLLTTLILELEAEKYILTEYDIEWQRFKNLKNRYQDRVDLALLKICYKLKPDIQDVL